MGTCSSSPVGTTSNWKVIKTLAEERIEYKNDPGVPPYVDDAQVIWRRLMSEPSVQKMIGECARHSTQRHDDTGNGSTLSTNSADEISRDDYFNMLTCWVEVNEFQSISVDRVRRLKGAEIFHMYINPSGPNSIPIPSPQRDHLRMTLKQVNQESVVDERGINTFVRERLDINVFAEVQKIIFSALYDNIYTKLKLNPEFKLALKEIKLKYNQVEPDDFEYYSPKLGSGGFGVVVRCRKISTGMLYAMKILRKADLFNCYRNDISRVDLEVRVLASLNHRYLTGMDYSFQTEQFGMIVMEIADGGTLDSIKDNYVTGTIPEVDLRFYMAEIADALNHIHRIGLIYRDIKAQNILLDKNGHIKLADLGGVVDTTRGRTIAPVSGKSNATFPFAPKFSNNVPCESTDNLTNPKRRKSLMGTRGYMAPEMVELQDRYQEARGYCYMVDWWSLGVMCYVLSIGKFPFLCRVDVKGMNSEEEYAALFVPPEFPAMNQISPEFERLLKKLLMVRESERIGYGLNGFRNIRNEPFFCGIDWECIASGTQAPPIRRDEEVTAKVFGRKTYSSFDDMILNCMEKTPSYDNAVISDKQQKYFRHWDYISPTTLRIEFGIANEMKQFEENDKLKRLLGDPSLQDDNRSMFSSLVKPIRRLSSPGVLLMGDSASTFVSSGSPKAATTKLAASSVLAR